MNVKIHNPNKQNHEKTTKNFVHKPFTYFDKAYSS